MQSRPTQTATQESCLAAKGFTMPDKFAGAVSQTTRTPPSAEKKAAFEAAATACGITMPARGGDIATATKTV